MAIFQMHAKTSVCMSKDFDADRLWLNGKEESVSSNQRLLNCLREVRKRAQDEAALDANTLEWKVHINSENNFPTAAGLASSAAGYACLGQNSCPSFWELFVLLKCIFSFHQTKLEIQHYQGQRTEFC